MTTVRAKFQLQDSTEHAWNKEGRTLTFRPHYDTSIPEDQRFAKYTPNGEFKMFCDNPVVIEGLELGKFYYFDITLAE